MQGKLILFLHFWSFVALHSNTLLSVFGTILALLRITRWGQAHARALEIVMAAVEKNQAQGVKNSVAATQAVQSPAVQEVLTSVAQTVDPGKETPSKSALFAKIVL